MKYPSIIKAKTNEIVDVGCAIDHLDRALVALRDIHTILGTTENLKQCRLRLEAKLSMLKDELGELTA